MSSTFRASAAAEAISDQAHSATSPRRTPRPRRAAVELPPPPAPARLSGATKDGKPEDVSGLPLAAVGALPPLPVAANVAPAEAASESPTMPADTAKGAAENHWEVDLKAIHEIAGDLVEDDDDNLDLLMLGATEWETTGMRFRRHARRLFSLAARLPGRQPGKLAS